VHFYSRSDTGYEPKNLNKINFSGDELTIFLPHVGDVVQLFIKVLRLNISSPHWSCYWRDSIERNFINDLSVHKITLIVHADGFLRNHPHLRSRLFD